MVHPVGVSLVFHTFLRCLILGVQAEVDNMKEETNATNTFDFTGKALSLHHHQSMLSIQEEVFFPHHTGKYQSVLITHQVPLLILMSSLWMHLYQVVLIAFIHHPRKISL